MIKKKTNTQSSVGNYEGSSNKRRRKKRRSKKELSDEYIVNEQEKIGEGTYGIVYRGRVKKDPSHIVAVKQFKATKEGEGISLTACREMSLLRELRHENIINLRDVILSASERALYMIFDYAEYDLYEILRFHSVPKRSQRLSEYTIKSFMYQILNGMVCLHENWVVHRDLKPSNILVMGEGDELGVVKIGDFGLARVFKSPLRPLSDNGVVVTIWYRAPELLLGSKHYTRAVDMWAIGCIFSELITTQPLFPGKQVSPSNPNIFQNDQVSRIFSILGKPTPERWPDVVALPYWKSIHNLNRFKETSQLKNIFKYDFNMPMRHKPVTCFTLFPENVSKMSDLRDVDGFADDGSEQAFDLLNRLLEYDPMRRITAAEALKHPWFRDDPLPSINAFFEPTVTKYARSLPAYPKRKTLKPK